MEAPGTDATSNTLCPASGFMYNGFYNRCIEISCSGGRDPATGRCITATTPGSTSGPLAPPTGVSAVGYTSAVSGVAAGKAHMPWVRSITSGVDGYRIRYAVWRQAHLSRIPDSDWTLVADNDNGTPDNTSDDTPITGAGFSITGLRLKAAYIVQVQAYKNDLPEAHRYSVWSPIVYVYTTAGQITGETSRLAGLPNPQDPITIPSVERPFDGRQLTYTYHVCADTLPTAPSQPGTTTYDPDALAAIRNGISQWQIATSTLPANQRLTVGHILEEDCDAHNVATEIVDTENNRVAVARNRIEMNMFCGSKEVPYAAGSGCMRRMRKEQGGRVREQRHVVIHNSEYQPVSGSCSQMFRVALHETGHVFGLDHPRSKNLQDYLRTLPDDYSVIWMPHNSLCTLTEHDLLAVRAIYESGYFANRYVSFP